MRRISLHPDEPVLLVQSEYNDGIRLTLRSFRGARWDAQTRVWQLPLEHRDGLLAQLEPYGFEIDDGVYESHCVVAPRPLDASEVEADGTLTISQLSAQIGGAIQRGFPRSVWVKGEVAGLDRVRGRKHWHFELIEKAASGDDVAAKLCVVVFSSQRERIERRLADGPEPLVLRDGLEIRVCGRLEYYSGGGRLELRVDDIDPDFAFGQLARSRREIQRQLEVEGLIGRNTALPWPPLPLRIGLVTALESDALHDVLQTLQRSRYGFRVYHVPAAVQGAQLEREVLSALEVFSRRADAVDLVLVVRGGGARSDLAWFDNLAVARAMARHPCKLLLGIGHERDRAVLDAVAHAEKTPTAAAELVVGMVALAEEQLDRAARVLAERTRGRLAVERERSQRHAARLSALSRASLRRARTQVERELALGLRRAARSRVSVEGARLSALAQRLGPEQMQRLLARESERREAQRDWLERATRVRLAAARQRLEVAGARLERAAVGRIEGHGRRLDVGAARLERAARARLEALAQRLEVAVARLAAVDPRRALARGFAIVHDASGRLVKSAADAPVGSVVRATLHEGRLEATVLRTLPKPREEER
jgi:exodeoxyribonuclease VII large subunit